VRLDTGPPFFPHLPSLFSEISQIPAWFSLHSPDPHEEAASKEFRSITFQSAVVSDFLSLQFLKSVIYFRIFIGYEGSVSDQKKGHRKLVATKLRCIVKWS
jgi:hypothetical protein